VVVATIFAGEVQVIGIQAEKSASITWEGNVATTSNKGGTFKFGTTDLPLDCVGELSDGVTTIDVVVFGCTTQQVISGGGVLKTGQTTCYDSDGNVIACAGTGQDGELQEGTARSYTDNGDGTITDNATGLIWEKLTDDGTIHDWNNSYTWEQAFQRIADLNTANFGGYSDWRLPNVNELQTLTDYGTFNPAVSAAFNSGDSFTQASFHWSSTSYAFPAFVWIVDVFDGNVLANRDTDSAIVRAVRGGS